MLGGAGARAGDWSTNLRVLDTLGRSARYEAALDNPGAILAEGQQSGDAAGGLWALDTVVVLLSVEPVW